MAATKITESVIPNSVAEDIFKISMIEMNNNINHSEGLQKDLKLVLSFGKILGLFPSLLATNRSQYYRILAWTFSIAAVCFPSLVHLILILYRLTVRHLIADMDTSTAASVFEGCLFFSTVFIFSSYMLCRRKCFQSLLEKWETYNSQLKFKEKDKTLLFHATSIALFITLLGICENLLFDAATFSKNANRQSHSNASGLELIYVRLYDYFATVIPYHWLLVSMVYFTQKMFTYCKNYMDILIIVFCRALYFKFKALIHQINVQRLFDAENQKFLKQSPKSSGGQGILSWDDVRSDFLILSDLVDLVNNFFHPLVFLSYINSVFNICLQLHYWIIPHGTHNQIQKIYISVSFFQFVLLALLITYFASNVNIWAQKIVRSLQHCPNCDYTVSVARLERFIIVHPIQIHGMGLFIITRKFLLSIFSFMFTFEIIMLQSMSPAISTSDCP